MSPNVSLPDFHIGTYTRRGGNAASMSAAHTLLFTAVAPAREMEVMFASAAVLSRQAHWGMFEFCSSAESLEP